VSSHTTLLRKSKATTKPLTLWKPVSILRLYRRTAAVTTATATTIAHHGIIMKGYSYSTTVIRCASSLRKTNRGGGIISFERTLLFLSFTVVFDLWLISNLNLPHRSRRISSTSSADPNLEDKTIMEQITMAQSKIKCGCKKKIPSQLYQDMLHDLSTGHVPPSFHAVVMGQPCVAFRGGKNNNNKDTTTQLLDMRRIFNAGNN
jgi:hypothetical protein